MNRVVRAAAGALLLTVPIGATMAQQTPSNCKRIHADMVEQQTATGCKPGHASCFIGEVDGNHGLRGTTYFKGDSATEPIKTSPAFVGYSGIFEYTTERGSLITRETGVSSGSQNVVTAYQRITGATGDYTGATGYLFVSGHNNSGHVVTRVTGEVCYP